MPIMTIAQALASSATGITIADTPANIAAALSNQNLLARVSLFTMNANGASSAGDAKALAGLGSRFSVNGFRYTVRDNVAALETAGNSAGLAIATALAVFDTAANIIAAASHSIMSRVSSVVMSTSASVTLAGLITMEALPSFSVNPGQTITLADTAANLLAITPTQVRGALKFYTVATNSVIAANKIASLTGLTGFSIAGGVTVTVADTAAAMIGASGTILPLVSNNAWAFAVSDGLSSLLTQQSGLSTLQNSITRMTVTVSDSSSVSVATLQGLTTALTHLAVANGQTLTLADIAANLLAAGNAVTALASATSLTADATVTAAQLATLAALHSFSVGGHHLLAVDSLANLQGISTAARTKATGITVQDSITHLVAAHGLPSGTTTVLVTPDALTHTAADISALAALGSGGVTLSVDTRTLSSLTVADTALHLISGAAAIDTLRGQVTVDLSLTDAGVTLTAAQAAALVALAPGNLAAAHDVVVDTGPAIEAVLDSLLGQGFTTITVNSGTFAGSTDQLFSPALFFNQSQASAQLSVSETVNAAQLVTLSLLPGFSLGNGVALTVNDTMAALAAASTSIATWATSVHVTDSETMSAATATQLAGLRTSLGNGFSLNGNLLIIADTPAAIVASPNAAGVALASAVVLSGNAIASVAQAQALIALSSRFSLGGYALAVSDTAATLVALSNGTATTINGWSGQVLLSADATVTVVNAQALARFTGFSSGSHHLTISDTAAHLLAATGITMPAIVTLSQAATLTVANLATLAAIPGFANSGGAITVSDTPLHLATMASNLVALASGFLLADPAQGHTSELALDATQFHTMMALTNLSTVGFHGGITITDTAVALTGLGTLPGTVSAERLSGDTTVSASAASTLLALPAFSVNGHALAVADTAAALAALSNGTATAINGWAGEVMLSADATVTVANAQALARFTGFSSGSHHLTISDTAAHLLAATGITMPASVTLSQAATLTVADMATLAAIPGFANTGGAITVADTPLHLATMPPNLVALASGFVQADPNQDHTAELVLNAAQFHAMMTLPGLSAVGFHGGISITDTAQALSGLGSLPGTVAAENLSGDTFVSGLTGSALAHLPNFSVNGHTLQVRDTVGGLLSPSATDGFAVATAVGLSQPTTVLVATATTLAAIPHISLAGVIVADTPAALAGMASNIASAVDQVHFATADGQATGYTLDAAHLLTLANLPNLSPVGLSQPIAVADTATHLVGLANQIAISAAGSLLQELSGAIAVSLSANGTVSAADLHRMATLPSFGDGGHTLTVNDTPTALLAAHDTISQFADVTVLGANTSAWTASAADATILAGLPGFSAGTAGLHVLDSVARIIDVQFAAGVLAASSSDLAANETINAAQANVLAQIANFSRNGHVLTLSDTPANIAQLSPSIAAESSSVIWTSTATVSVQQYEALLSMTNLGSSLPHLTVADTAANLAFLAQDDLRLVGAVTLQGQVALTADAAQALTLLPNFSAAPGAITIHDTAANLLRITGQGSVPDDSAAEQIAGHIVLSADATLTTAQATLLAPMAPRLDTASHALVIQDSPANLLASAAVQTLSAEITGLALSGSTPWSVSAASAAGLARLSHFSVGPGFTVSDGASNLIAPANSAGLALASHVTLSADATVNVATATSLHAISNFDPTAHAITISDGAGRLATLGNGTAAMASAIQLSGNAIVTVVQYQALLALNHFSANGNFIVVSDTAANLLSLSPSDYASAALLSLSADVTMTADQAEQLASLPRFHSGIGNLLISDTAAHLVHATTGSTPDDWLGELTASSVTLTSDAVVTAWQATLLATLGARLHTGGHSLIVSDTPSNLLSGGNAAGLALAGWETLSSDVTVTASQAAQLAALSGFHKGAAIVTVSGAANELLYGGNSAGLALADSTVLSSSADVTVAQAEALVALTGFSTGSATLQIIDSAAHLLTLVGQPNATLTSLTIGLSDDATLTAAQLQTLLSLPETFTLNGHTVTVFDTARHIAAVNVASLPFAVSFVLAGDAFISAAQANAVAANGTDVGDNTIIVIDTAAALLDGANASGLALATMALLSTNATVSAADATALVGNLLFNTGGHHLTIRDTAGAILSLDASVAAEVSGYVLAGDQDVTGSQLSAIAHLGSQFSLGGHALHVVDSDTGLAALNSFETALVAASVLSADATVTAARAEILAALPSFSLQGGVHLTIQDTVPHLLALSNAAQNAATLIRLDHATPVTLTVADADGLAALMHFHTMDATITVTGTVAQLNGSVGWQSVETSYIITDSVDNILAAASGGLIADAASVGLSANGVVDTADLMTLAGLSNFAHGPKLLTVFDGPAAVAAHVSTILSVATGVRINTSPFISAAQAEALVPLQTASMLAFTGSNHIAIEDSYATLIDGDNAGGLALATAIRVLDTAAHLLTATAHDWGSVAPDYALSANATIVASAATTFAGLASHFIANGHSQIVADDASHVVAAAADIGSLGATVHVTDTAAHVATNAASLISLGSAITAISFTDSLAISATVAAGLVGLQGAFTGTIDVADTASAVRGVVNSLLALGSAVHSITVADTAAHVAASVTGAHPLQNLGDILTIVLTDSSAVSAASAAGLLPVLGNLAVSTLVAVADTAVHIAASATNLQALGSVLGDVSFTGASTMTAATAVGLLPVASHLVSTVAVVDTALNIVANATDLGSVGAISTVQDTAAHVSVNLDSLETYSTGGGTVHAITLTNGGTPMIDVSIAQITSDSDAIALIGSAFRLRVSDTAAHVQSDLIAGTSSILSSIGIIGAIVVNPGTISLTVAEILAASVDDGVGSALALMTGETLVVTGAAVADINTLLGLGVPPTHIAISDTAANIQSDLASGSSAILNGLNSLSTIAVSDHGTITLSAALAETVGVANNAHSAMALMTSGTFAVDNAAVSDLVTLAGLTAVPSTIAIDDTAAHIQADLASGGSSLLAHRSLLGAVVVGDSGVITLTESRVLTAHVDDGAGSVLSLMTGGTLAVTGVPVADIAMIAGLPVSPASIAVTDTAAHIQSDLASGSSLVSHVGLLSGITVSPAGTITLTSAQVQAVHVDDGAGSVFDLMTGETLHVTGVSVAQVGTVLGLDVAPASITVSDTAANIQADLVSGTSALLANVADISAVSVSNAAAITLTMAQVQAAGVTGVLAITTGGSLHVTAAAVADIATLLGLTNPPTQIAIDDTAANIQADLTGGSSALLAHRDLLTALHINDSGVITLTASLALTAHVDDGASSVLSFMSGGTLAVTGATIANLNSVAALPVAPASIAVTDTAAHIQSDLTGASTLVSQIGLLSGISVSPAGTITLTSAQVQAAHVDDGAGSVFALMTGETLHVTGVSVADISTVLGLGVAPASITVSDTAAHIRADLIAGTSALVDNAGSISAVAISDAGAITLTMAQVEVAGVTGVLATTTGGALHVTAAAISDVAILLGLTHSPTQIAIDDTAANMEADLTGGSSVLLAHRDLLSALHINDSGVVTLGATLALTAHVDDGAGSVLSYVSGGTLAVTGATIANLNSVVALPVAPTTIAVTDTAAHIQSDLTGTSALLANRALLSGITVSPAGTITLTSAQVLAAHVDDGAGSVFGLMSGETLHVTGMAVTDIGTVLGLGVAPTSITVSDTAAHIQADLIAGTSALVDNAGSISAVAISNASPISLTVAQVETAGVTGILSITTGGALHVTAAAVADIPSMLALTHPPTEIAIDDTAGDIETDLTGGSSTLVAHRDLLTALHINDSGVITLTAVQALTAHVDDGAGSVLSFMTGGTLAVINATVANLNSVAALPVAPTSIGVSDTAAHIQSDLTGGTSTLLANVGLLSGITVSPAGTITLTSVQVQAAHVDDGAGSVFDLMTGETLHVTGALVADIGTVLGLGVPPASITVSDTAAHIQADLVAGTSALIDNDESLSAVTVSNAGAITLTMAQLTTAGVTTVLAKTTAGSLHVTAAAVSDMATLLGLTHPPTQIAIDDTAAHIQADLAGAATLVTHRDLLTAVHVNDSGVITLTATQALAAHVDDGAGSVLSFMTGGTLAVTGATIANLDSIAALPVAPTTITVTDAAAHIQSDLAGASVLVANVALLSGITVSPAGTITLTSAQVQAAHVDDGAGSVLSLMTGETLHVSGVLVADIGTVLGLGVPPASITVSDTAAHIQADLIAGTSALIDNAGSISAVVATGAGTISLTTAQVETAGVSGVLAITTGANVHITDGTVADLDALAGLGLSAGSITVSDTAADIQADLASGSPVLLAHRTLLHDVVNSDAGTITLTAAQVTAAHVDDGAGSVFSHLTGGSLVVTGVAIANLATIAAMPVAPTNIAVGDTAAHIQADLTSGSPALVSSLAVLSGIVVNPAGTITLTSVQVQAAHVDDGVGSVLALMSGETLHVTGVAVADIGTVLGLGVAPASITVSDTAAHIQADLIAGTSHVLDNIGEISAIAVSPAGTITLTEAQLTAAGVDDGAGSAFALMTGETLHVTGVPIADIATMLALGVPPASIAVSDTAANIAADLATGSPELVSAAASVGSILVNDAGTISLTVAQAEAAGVATALAKATGGSFTVTGALISDLDTLTGMAVVPDHIAVSDTAAHIQSDLTGGSSKLIADRAAISAITNSNAGTITLTEAQLVAVHVDDGAGSVFSKLTGGSLAVTGLTVAQLPTVGALGVPPDSYAVSDTAAHLQADLISGSSNLLAYLGSISGIAVSPGGTITLTSAQVQAASVDDFGGSALAKMTGLTLHVTAVAIADIGTILALGVAPSHITISDTAAHIQADLTGGGVLLANAGSITAITISDAGTVSLTVAEAETAGVAGMLALATGGHFHVIGALVSDLDTVAALAATPDQIDVSDTAAHLQADLASGTPVLLAHRTLVGTITNSNAGTITLTDAQVSVAHVDDGAGSVLSKLSGGSLAVSAVTVAHIATILGLAVAPSSIAVVDTAAHIGVDLAIHTQIVGHIGSISSITVSPGGNIHLNVSQILAAGVDDGAGSAFALMSGDTLQVTGVAVADIATVMALGVPPDSISISDTAAHIQADLASGTPVLLANLAAISDITVTSGTTITLTVAQAEAAGVADGGTSVMALLSGANYVVTGAAVGDIAALAALSPAPHQITVSDTAANIEADLTGSSDLLAHRALLGTITNSNAGVITLTSAQATAAHVDDGSGSIFSKISGGSLTVNGVTVADLATIASLPFAPTHVTVSDTAAHLQADLTGGTSHLLSSLSLLSGITNSNAGTITLTKAQVLTTYVDDGAGSVLGLMSGGSLTVTGLAVADIATVMALGVAPTHVTVSDTAAHIQADLIAGTSHLLDNIGTIDSIAVSPSGTITLTSAQVQAAGVDNGAGSALALMTGVTLVVTGVAVADITTILGLGVAPAHITVLDTAANVDADMSGGAVIGANAASITSVKLSDASVDVVLATTVYNELDGVATFDESALTITGTAADLLTAHGAVPGMLSAALHVTMDDNPVGMTAANATIIAGIIGSLTAMQTLQVVDTAAHLLDSGNAAGVSLATTNALSAGLLSSASYITTLAHVHNFDANGQTIEIQDTVTHLLNAAYADGIAIGTHVEPDTDYTLSGADMTSLAALHNVRTNGHTLTIQDTAAHIAALSQPTLGFASISSVHDSSANVSASLNALQSAVTGHSHPLQIVLSDGVAHTPSIIVTAVTYAADTAVLDAITTAGAVRVLGTASQLAALASTLASDTVVNEVDVSDTAANILSNLTALNSIGGKFMQATISDASVNASAVASLLTISNLVASGLTIIDTASQIAAAIAANGAPAVTFMNAHTVQLSADSVVTAAEALALESLTSFSKNGHTLKVWDTAAHLTDSVDGYLAAVNNAIVDGVYLKTTGGTATVTGATGSALAGITGFSKNNPNATSNTLIIQDTAAHLESAYGTISAHRASFDSIVVSASTTVTDAVFGHLLTLSATAGGGVAITVRDTAANIAANAPAQTSGSPSITPTTWALSGSATISAANAAILGGLAGFSAGAFTITLLADVASLSVADANKIGALGATFHLGSHVMHVAGDVATVSGLSGPAKSIVTPDITDTFAHVSTMTKAGNLLGGTITITDSGTVSVAQASNFLDLLKIGGGAGIAAANVHFNAHVESVTDTLSNIQTLTSSGGWTSNAGVHSDFNLVVADTVAHLIDASNLTALEGMNGTTFGVDQIATATDAETLAGIATSINFSVGAHALTVQDTPTHLLDPANSDGEALAAIWQLNADATVVTSEAETLLTTSKFHLNHTLTVSDTSDNLLDGVLSTDISGSPYSASVEVELSGAETLDAQTAAHLVALPGFTNNGNLSIQDDSPYLLNAANHTAEVAASSVTLNGDETVSALTAGRLAGVPNFTLGGNHLLLASDDYADAATLKAIGDFDTGFDANGHSVTMTQNALTLTPTEYAALQSDNIVLNGHALSALATGFDATSGAGTIHVTGNGVDQATANVYAADGTLLSQATVNASFDVSDTIGNAGNALVVTETVGVSAASSESAPIIALERNAVEAIVTGDSATFAGSGAVQVAMGEYVNLYTTATLPVHPVSPALVYDSGAHTLALAVDGHAAVVLVTLGGATTPASLDPSEILIRHFT